MSHDSGVVEVFYRIKRADGAYYKQMFMMDHVLTFVLSPSASEPIPTKKRAVKLVRSMREHGYKVRIIKVTVRQKWSEACPDCGVGPSKVNHGCWFCGYVKGAW